MDEIFEYLFTRLDPVAGDHIDPPSLAIYETLLRKGPDGRPLPGLADSWRVSDEGCRWRLRLRRGAAFHSGDVCDAKAVLAALNRCRWGDGLKRQVWYWDPVDTVAALDDRTVEFQLHYPCWRLPILLWGAHTAICNDQRRNGLAEEYGVVLADGTGPYRLARFSRGEVVAERVAWSSRVASSERRGPGTIRWRSLVEEEQRRVMLAGEGADVVRAVSPEWIADDRWRYYEQDEDSQFYLALNFSDPRGFANLDFRRAVEAFVDRQAIVDTALSGRGDARRSPVPCADEWAGSFDPASSRQMSIAEATQLLDAMGYISGPDGVRERDGQPLRVDCVTQNTEPFRRLAAELARQLRQAGVALEFRFMEPFEDFYRACEQRPASFMSKWLWPDAMEAIMGFSRSTCDADGGGNWQGSHIGALDDAFDDFLQARCPSESNEASRRVQDVFMRYLPYIPLCSPRETYAVRRGMKDFALVPRTLYPSYLGTTG